MYQVKEVDTSMELTALIVLMNENPNREHDCDRETYITNVIGTMYLKPNHRITVLYANERAIGYLIVRHDNYITNEVIVLDIYITKEYQGKKCMDILIGDLIPIALNVKSLRIKWDSRTFDTDFWDGHAFGCKVESYKIFYVELTDSAKVILSKKLKGENK